MQLRVLWVALMLLACFAASSFAAGRTATAAEEWQFFRVNAQYRGTVKKGFENLGCGIAWFKELPNNEVQAIVHVCALHPEKGNEKYAFRLNLILQRQTGKLNLVKELYADFAGIIGERQDQVRQLVGLLAYMRDFAAGTALAPSITSCGADLSLSDQKLSRGKTREITCKWASSSSFSGKFFFDQSQNGNLVMTKFRFKSSKLSVSLVVDTAESINSEFAQRPPFAEIVFK